MEGNGKLEALNSAILSVAQSFLLCLFAMGEKWRGTRKGKRPPPSSRVASVTGVTFHNIPSECAPCHNIS